ncbi:MAG TPA: hypothetical protein VJ939_05830, partial [Bacteroidales bacterium]|nr:hypothetical protein [Bacteroidales bacterium]
LELAVKEFLIKNSYKYFISFDSIKFNRAIRELENTFIKTQKDSYDSIVIEFQNPSIQDFLINYLNVSLRPRASWKIFKKELRLAG